MFHPPVAIQATLGGCRQQHGKKFTDILDGMKSVKKKESRMTRFLVLALALPSCLFNLHFSGSLIVVVLLGHIGAYIWRTLFLCGNDMRHVN